MKRVLGSIRRADERYHMIEDGDRICIGVSGGKDSLLLMEALKLYQNFPEQNLRYAPYPWIWGSWSRTGKA